MDVRYNVISGDSHLDLAPERWTARVPETWRHLAPRRITFSGGGEGIEVEGKTPYALGLAVTGKPYQEHRLDGVSYEGSPGTGPPEQRIREQDMDGVDAEVMFTSWKGGATDTEGGAAVLHAYNEFLGEEYAAAYPDRLLAMGLLPKTGVDAAIAEMEYCQRVGLKGVTLFSFPNGNGLPLPEDDRFWQAALDLNVPLTIHIGVSGRPGEPLYQYPREPANIDILGHGSDPIGVLSRFGTGHPKNMIQLIFAGVFERFPGLRFWQAETMIGWVPYGLEQLDDIWERSRYWAADYFGLEAPPKPPSAYIRQHVVWGFLRDPFGVTVRHQVGIKNAAWGSDFAHSAGDWPESRKVIDEIFAGVPEDEKYPMVAGNAIDFFHLDNEA